MEARNVNYWWFGVAGLLALLLVTSSGIIPMPGNNNPPPAEAVAAECNNQQSITRLLAHWSLNESELAFGSAIDFDRPADAGNGRFSDQPLRSRQALKEFLNSGTPKANDARVEVIKGLQAAVNNGLLEQDSYDEVVASDGTIKSVEIWTPVQFLVDVSLVGNASHQEGIGAVYNGERRRAVKAGDILLMPVSPDSCEVLIRAVIRADCGNPGIERIIPDEPNEPPRPGTKRICNPETGRIIEVPEGQAGNFPPPGSPECEDESPPQPKCFAEDGTPIFSGEFCGTPDSGPEQQPPEESDDTDTPGYEDESAEDVDQTRSEECPDADREPTTHGCEVPDSQNGCRGCGGGDDSVIDEPGDDAEDNPDYDGTEPSQGSSEGTSDPEDTDHSDETASEGDPGGW